MFHARLRSISVYRDGAQIAVLQRQEKTSGLDGPSRKKLQEVRRAFECLNLPHCISQKTALL